MNLARLIMVQGVRDAKLDADFSAEHPVSRSVNFWEFRDYCLKLAKLENKWTKSLKL
jgi:hypothetical protein